MPFSSKTGKHEIGTWFAQNADSVNRILDVGAGSGTYPKLIKTDFNCCTSASWVGVEAWEPYISQYKLPELYDNIIHSDIRVIDWGAIGTFDVAIAGDILEHMTKEEAIKLVDDLLRISTILIISIPIVYMPQDAYKGNPYEIHVKPDWSHEEVMETWGANIVNHHVRSKASKVGVYWISKR